MAIISGKAKARRAAQFTALLDRGAAVYVGVHQQIGRILGADVEPAMRELTSPLTRAMLRQMERLFGSTQSQPNPKAIARRTRYYFHVGNGGHDETGEEFSTSKGAIARLSSGGRTDERT